MKNLIRYGTRVHAIALGAFALILTTGCAYSIGPGAGVKVVSNIPYHTMTVKFQSPLLGAIHRTSST